MRCGRTILRQAREIKDEFDLVLRAASVGRLVPHNCIVRNNGTRFWFGPKTPYFRALEAIIRTTGLAVSIATHDMELADGSTGG